MVVKSPRRVVFGFVSHESKVVVGAKFAHEAAWRSLIELCHEQSFFSVEVELWFWPPARREAERLKQHLEGAIPGSAVRLHEIFVRGDAGVIDVFTSLTDFCEKYRFTDGVDYYLHLPSAGKIEELAGLLLVDGRFLPAKVLWSRAGMDEVRGGSKDGGAPQLDALDLNEVRKGAFEARMKLAASREPYSFPDGTPIKSPKLQAILREVVEVVHLTDLPILLCGPSGAGRGEIARKIFELKRSRHTQRDVFVEVNCATLRKDLSMSALFGEAAPAASRRRPIREGFLKRADGGVLFLDEVEVLGLDEQAMLVKAVENGIFYPVGSDDEQRSRFQLVAGTSVDLEGLVHKGQLRRELFQLLHTWRFDLPPLMHRKEDIEPFVDYELQRGASLHGERVRFSKNAREDYFKFARSEAAVWPGNFRDVKSSVARLIAHAERGEITQNSVKREVARLRDQWSKLAPAKYPDSAEPGEYSTYSDAVRVLREVGISPREVDLFEQAQLAAVIGVVRSCTSIAEAGRKLFAVSRKGKGSANDTDRLRKYLAKFGIDSKRIVGTELMHTGER